MVAVMLVLRTVADVWMIQNGTAIEAWVVLADNSKNKTCTRDLE